MLYTENSFHRYSTFASFANQQLEFSVGSAERLRGAKPLANYERR